MVALMDIVMDGCRVKTPALPKTPSSNNLTNNPPTQMYFRKEPPYRNLLKKKPTHSSNGYTQAILITITMYLLQERKTT